jgi:lysophospholipase L1-like esterase
MTHSYSLLFLGLLFSALSSTAIPLRKGILNNVEVTGDRIAARAEKVPLSILPLGASITWGVNSASGNGYRGPLRDQLTSAGWQVDMVGSKKHGNMTDSVRCPQL